MVPQISNSRFRSKRADLFDRLAIVLGPILTVASASTALYAWFRSDIATATILAVVTGVLLIADLFMLFRYLANIKVLRDQQLRASRNLASSENGLRNLIESIDLPGLVLEPNGNILQCNQSIASIAGYPQSELVGKNWFALFGPESHPRRAWHRLNLPDQSAIRQSESNLTDKSGTIRTIHWNYSYVSNPDGTIRTITCLGTDLTEHRQMSHHLARLSKAIEQSSLSVVITDPQGNIEWISPAFTRISGYTLEEAKGQNPRLLKSGLLSPRVYSELWLTILSGKTWRGELLNRNKYGTLYWEAVTITPVTDPSGQITDFIGVKQDITERIAADQEMKKLSAAIFQSMNAIAVLDPQGRVEYANPRFCEATGRSMTELIGLSVEELLSIEDSPASFKAVVDTIQRQKIWRANFPMYPQTGGEQIWVRCSISPIHHEERLLSYLLVGEDISHEMETISKLSESEKMAAVGVLAAGVSHEFKNLLGGIIGNASFALEELEAGAPRSVELARETLSQVIEISERANQVAMSLLTYSKVKTADFSQQDLHKLIRNTASLVENELKSREIELVTYFDEIPPVEMDAGKIQQLILNLLINAEQAITESGVITIAAILDSPWVHVRVGDTGCGIPRENLNRIFDPFFSTKGVWGKDSVAGTGMGLAICRNVAREHHGDITVDSKVGVGSTFTLTLPLERHDKTDQSSEIKLPSDRKVILFTLDKTIFGNYFTEACERGITLIAVDSINRVDRELASQTSLLVCDARFTGKVELFKMIEICRLSGIPYVMINCGELEYQLSPLYDHARHNFADIPDFAGLMDFVSKSSTANSGQDGRSPSNRMISPSTMSTEISSIHRM